MNKLTSTLAGLALVAGASIAPAFAQGNFTTAGPFTFSFTPVNSFTVSNIPVTYNPFGGTAVSGLLSLSGGTELGTSGLIFSNTQLSFVGGGQTITGSTPFATVVPVDGTGTYIIASGGSTTAGDTFNLSGGAPVPEASTVLSFGALLALGGFAVLRRKAAVKTAA